MTKMVVLQNGRILRFLIIIGAVVLTIFIYASYYSNTALTIPGHLRASPALTSSSSVLSDCNSGVVVIKNLSNLNEAVEWKGDTQGYKNITIEIHNLNSNGNDLSDKLRYSHVTSNGSTGSVSSNDSTTSTDAAQKPNERHHSSIYTNSSLIVQRDKPDFMPPNSNIQTFVLNADRILKNLTTLPGSVPSPQQIPYTKDTNRQQQSQIIPQSLSKIDRNQNKKQSLTSPQTSAARPPSALISGIRIKASNSSSSAIVQSSGSGIDPTQGIPTRQIYESGHLDVNSQLCPNKGDSIKLLIIITSAQQHQEARLAIRQTWGHYGVRRDVAIAFILGRTNNKTLEMALNQENYIYGDLIRGHFIDSYNNLTLKTISALEWVDQKCPQVRFVLKTDDDMFINVPKLMVFIDKHRNDKHVIYGRLAKKWKPIRNKKSKYFVSVGQFSATIYPPFTTGPAYVMSADIIHDLYVRALQETYLKLEDVFTTGIVAQQLGIKRVHVNEFLNRRIAFNPCNIRKTISVHMIKSNEQFDLWKKLLDQTTKCK